MVFARLCQARRRLAQASQKSGDSARLQAFLSPMRARLAGRRSCSAGPFGREQLTRSGTRRNPKVLVQLNSWLQETMVHAPAQEILKFTRVICDSFSLFEEG